MRAIPHFFAAFLFATLTGCATVVHGTTQEIPIVSSSPGARVVIDDTPVGVTPMVAKVSRTQPHVVSFVVDSVVVDRVALDRQMSPWVLPDVFLMYIAPSVVDIKNGAAYNFPGDTLRSNLRNPSAGVRRVPLADGVRASALTTSVLIGLGSGHAIVDLPAKRFFWMDAAAGTLAFAGFALAYGGKNATGEVIALSGAGLLAASRIWQITDLVKRTDPTNR